MERQLGPFSYKKKNCQVIYILVKFSKIFLLFGYKSTGSSFVPVKVGDKWALSSFCGSLGPLPNRNKLTLVGPDHQTLVQLGGNRIHQRLFPESNRKSPNTYPTVDSHMIKLFFTVDLKYNWNWQNQKWIH
jgi:hypothetical protein